jgi:hypothetical protein
LPARRLFQNSLIVWRKVRTDFAIIGLGHNTALCNPIPIPCNRL